MTNQTDPAPDAEMTPEEHENQLKATENEAAAEVLRKARERVEAKQRELTETALMIPVTDAPVTMRMLQLISETNFVPKSLRGDVPAMLGAIKAGQELGLGPMTSMRAIDIIDGSPTPSAELLNAMVRKAGHRIKAITLSATECVALFIRSDLPPGEEPLKITLTMEEMANVTYTKWEGDRNNRHKTTHRLVDKDNWKNYPMQMLWARTLSWGCRVEFPDVTLKLGYLADELAPADEVHPPTIETDSYELDEKGNLIVAKNDGSTEVIEAIPEADVVDEFVCELEGCEEKRRHTHTGGISEYVKPSTDSVPSDEDAKPEPEVDDNPFAVPGPEDPPTPAPSLTDSAEGETPSSPSPEPSTTGTPTPDTESATPTSPSDTAEPPTEAEDLAETAAKVEAEVGDQAVSAVLEGFPGSDIEETWNELIALLEADPAFGTMPRVQARLTRVCELMAIQKIWPIDGLRKLMVHWMKTPQLTDLKKDDLTIFANKLYDKAKAQVAELLAKEQEDPADE